jgi:hypothetical protein
MRSAGGRTRGMDVIQINISLATEGANVMAAITTTQVDIVLFRDRLWTKAQVQAKMMMIRE